MRVDRALFLEDGYLLVRNVVPPAQLQEVRDACEILVDRQRQLWARDRKEDDPPGGAWETSAQPRLALSRAPLASEIDESSALAVEIWLTEGAHGVSSQLLGVEDAGVTEMMLMCNPVSDRGPARWHRDMYPPYCAPLQGYVDDILESGPRYVQWNISLYDDDVLCVIPGSHARLNTAEEDEYIARNPNAPVPGMVQTHLEPGDGVVYILPILHWASNYTSKMRRCLHGGFSMFAQYPDPEFARHLSPPATEAFARWTRRAEDTADCTERVLRAALERDGKAYLAALDELHPGRGGKGRLLSTVFLSKTAQRICDLKRPDFDSLPDRRRSDATGSHPMTLQWGAAFADRFSDREALEIWKRYGPVDAAIQSDTEQMAPGFQGAGSLYNFKHMPNDLTVTSFVASWKS